MPVRQAAFHQAGINGIHESLDLSTLLFMYSICGTRPHTTSICSSSSSVTRSSSRPSQTRTHRQSRSTFLRTASTTFAMLSLVDGTGQYVTLANLSLTEILIYIRVGAALRARSTRRARQQRQSSAHSASSLSTQTARHGGWYAERRRRREHLTEEMTWARMTFAEGGRGQAGRAGLVRGHRHCVRLGLEY